jgi:hypothetical protein
VWSLKPERWGSPLVQEKYREKRTVTRDIHNSNNNNNNNNNNVLTAIGLSPDGSGYFTFTQIWIESN